MDGSHLSRTQTTKNSQKKVPHFEEINLLRESFKGAFKANDTFAPDSKSEISSRARVSN
jgi:hypothetical protein